MLIRTVFGIIGIACWAVALVTQGLYTQTFSLKDTKVLVLSVGWKKWDYEFLPGQKCDFKLSTFMSSKDGGHNIDYFKDNKIANIVKSVGFAKEILDALTLQVYAGWVIVCVCVCVCVSVCVCVCVCVHI
eukprot:GHVR01086388.1.p1 GENE.GHVR01086388.1~~GHVR01086388.1.p1  ORF type:complete len:130 (+),score=36.36 GHVR01086388.1:48-437(+)